MRRFTSILLICLLLFNALGFYGFISAINYHHHKALMRSFDADAYNEQETIILEIPHSLPYAVEQMNFQRVDGEIKYNGAFYKLVKQRVSFDSIFLVVLKDKLRERTDKVLTDYSKSLADPQSGDQPVKKLSLNFYKDYFGSSFSLSTISLGWIKSLERRSAAPKHFVPVYTHSIFTPPETV